MHSNPTIEGRRTHLPPKGDSILEIIYDKTNEGVMNVFAII